MHYSQLRLDMRSHARGQLLLRDVYALHRRLCRAFSSFVEVNPENDPAPFLYRIETGPPAWILVQSAIEPDWDRAFHNAPGYTTDVRTLQRGFDFLDDSEGKSLRFRLLANPVRTKRKSDDPKDKKRFRRPISDPRELWNWLERKLDGIARVVPRQAEFHGLDGDELPTPPKRILRGKKPGLSLPTKPDKDIQIVARLFEGSLTLTEPEKLKAILAGGIGRGKSFGCGLLSVASA